MGTLSQFKQKTKREAERMKYTIVVDSVAALPEFVLVNRPIKVLPISVVINDKAMPDSISEEGLIDIYQGSELSIKSQVTTLPPSPEQIRDFIINEVAPYSDYAICQSLSRVASPIFDNFASVSHQISKDAKEARGKLGIEHPFRMTSLNSGTTLAGQGLIAIYADMLLSKGVELNEYSLTIEKFTKAVRTYAIVRDILYSRKRAIEKGVETIGFAPALLGKTFGVTPIVEICNDQTVPVQSKRGFDAAFESIIRYAIDRIVEGLFIPVVNISYAGDLNDIKNLPIMDELEATAKKHKVKLCFGVMGLGSSTVYGPGGFSIGIAPKNQKDKPS